jgi:hypothetical protein
MAGAAGDVGVGDDAETVATDDADADAGAGVGGFFTSEDRIPFPLNRLNFIQNN